MVLQIYEQGTVLVLSMQQPGGNKFTIELMYQLLDSITNPAPHITGIVISGNGKIFSVGGDIDGMVAGIKMGRPSKYVDEIVPLVNQVILAIMTSPLPVVSVIDGSVAGGALSLAFSCDFVIAKPDAKLSFAFGGLALSPDSGSTLNLLRKGFTRRYLLRAFSQGSVVKTQDVAEFGVFDKIVGADLLLEEATNIVNELSDGSLWTFSKTKMLFLSQELETIQKQLEMELETIHDSCLKGEFQDRVMLLYKKLNSKN